MKCLHALFVSCALAVAASAPAQDSLAALQRQFAAEAEALAERSAPRSERDQLLARHLEVLQKFLTDRAAGDDRWNGRLMLADLHLQAGRRDDAAKALAGIDSKEAPGVLQLSAAAMAQYLKNQTDLRQKLIDGALAKPAPLRERLAMARLLGTVLHEVERGEGVFKDALAAAKDDEERALIRFHRADAMRDREDLADNAGFEQLELLARELPGTYWGSVAKDRLRATELKPGEDAIPFRAKTLGGDEFVLADQKGKAVVLVFWSAADRDAKTLVDTLAEAVQKDRERIVVVGVNLDRDAAGIERAAKKLGITFPVIGDGLGIETDVALRWFVEGPVVHVIDSHGKIQALGLHAGTADGRTELHEAIAAAIKP